MDDLMDSKSLPSSYLDLVSPGVFGVFDKATKKVFISCSNNVILGIASVVTKVKKMDHQCSNMVSPEVKILYLGDEPKLEGYHIMSRLSSEGWEIMNSYAPIKYEAKIRTQDGVVMVTLRSSRGNERIVAGFDSMESCLDWFNENYPNGYVGKVVSLDSELTTRLREELE